MLSSGVTPRIIRRQYGDHWSQFILYSEQKNMTHVVYSMTMMSELQVYANIVRDPAIKIEYTCIYPFIRTLSLDFPVLPEPR